MKKLLLFFLAIYSPFSFAMQENKDSLDFQESLALEGLKADLKLKLIAGYIRSIDREFEESTYSFPVSPVGLFKRYARGIKAKQKLSEILSVGDNPLILEAVSRDSYNLILCNMLERAKREGFDLNQKFKVWMHGEPAQESLLEHAAHDRCIENVKSLIAYGASIEGNFKCQQCSLLGGDVDAYPKLVKLLKLK